MVRGQSFRELLAYLTYLWKSTHQLIYPLRQVFGAQMGVTLEHLHGFMAGDSGDFLITESGLGQAGYRLVAQVVKAQKGWFGNLS